jgi:hypothetical protein
MIRWFFLFTFAAAAAAGCGASQSPQLRVLGVQEARADREVVFVQVTNPASRPMRLTKLEYVFASNGELLSQGEVPLYEREIPAGSAVVFEVPLDAQPAQATTLQGRLTAELDQVVRHFNVSAQLHPH